MHMPEGRHTCTERAGPTPDTRRAHAGYSLHVRRLRSSAHVAHTQHVSNACPVLHAWAIRSAR